MKLVKTIIFLVGLGFGMPLANAEGGKMALGLQGGMTFPDFHVSNTSLASQYDNKDGWLAGLYLEFGLWTITLRPELNYVTKGYTVAHVAEVKNHYVEIPVLLKINPLSAAPISPFVLAGPQWSRQTSSDVTVLGSTASFSNPDHTWDIAAILGLGAELNLSPNIGLNVQGRYAYGFRDVDPSTTEVKTRAFYLIAGLSIQDPF